MTETISPEQQDMLRKPFPDNLIERNQDGMVFVGHSAVTDRLLKVDAGWSWEPFAIGADGSPLVSYREMGERTRKNGDVYVWSLATMWIRLTVCGVTRVGVGETEVYPWSDSTEKKLISDALKNAAMRFGVALDLWAKEDLLAVPPPEPITDAQVKQVSALFDQIADEDARRVAKVDWVKTLPVALPATPADQFDAVYASAMDAIENLSTETESE